MRTPLRAATRSLGRLLCALAALLVFGAAECGDPTIGGACGTDCDCAETTAPVKCPGEWTCGADRRCHYECRDFCDATTPCAAGETCPANGGTCSRRTACP